MYLLSTEIHVVTLLRQKVRDISRSIHILSFSFIGTDLIRMSNDAKTLPSTVHLLARDGFIRCKGIKNIK